MLKRLIVTMKGDVAERYARGDHERESVLSAFEDALETASAHRVGQFSFATRILVEEQNAEQLAKTLGHLFKVEPDYSMTTLDRR